MANPSRLTRGDAVVGALTVTDLTVKNTLTYAGDLNLDDITLDVIDATSVTTDILAVGGGDSIRKITALADDVNFAEVAAGATGTATMTLTGAKVGDVVVANAPSLTSGLVFAGAAVTANNTVTLRVVNATASPIDEGLGTFRLLLFKLTA